MKPSSLPAGYADEINLQEKLSDTELQSAIAEIEELRADAAKYQAKGDADLARTLTQKSHQAYEALKAHYPVFAELKAQWKQFSKDLKNLSGLEEELEEHQVQTASIQQEFESTMTQRNEEEKTKEAKINNLKQRLNIESPHAAYRTAMVDYAKLYDKEHAERIAQRAKRIEELTKAGKIKEDAEGVSIPEIGLKTASKAVQEKALDAFGDKLQANYGREDHQGFTSGTKKVYKEDIDAHGTTFGAWELGSNEQLNAMHTWIKANFPEAKDKKAELYILQMINPDLFEGMWMKDTNGNGRQYLLLRRDVNYRDVGKHYSPSYGCGLFLVQKRM